MPRKKSTLPAPADVPVKNAKPKKQLAEPKPVLPDQPGTPPVAIDEPAKPEKKTRSRLRKTAIQNIALSKFKNKASEYLLVGGSRSGKTFIIIYHQLLMAEKYPGSRHLIARYRFNHAKNSIWLDTLKKVMRLAFPDLKVSWRNTDYYLELANGSQVWLAGLDDKDRTEKILGMEFLTVFLNEASQISHRKPRDQGHNP